MRLIPARAGNTRSGAFSSVSKSAHPRSRGEHKLTRKGDPAHIGSSPLARGTLSWWRRGILALPAHPRSRGEHCYGVLDFAPLPGSSPLARGTPGFRSSIFSSFRLIPARAGNTSAGDGDPVPVTAHPRSRGEHVEVPLCTTGQAGSSPLARGTLRQKPHFHDYERLIPARAGNTGH